MTSDSLHGLTRRLQHDFRTVGLTAGQDKLLDSTISELEHRHHHPEEWTPCYCELCVDPFPWEQLDLDTELAALEEGREG